MQNTVIVIGGPDGAGKTTFARQFVVERLSDSFEFFNADLIADGVLPVSRKDSRFRGEREFLGRFESKVGSGESYVVVSTLSGLDLAGRLEELRKDGYRIEIVYLWLPNADFAVRRVAERAMQDGRNIPEITVRREFDRSYSNFVDRYRKLADRWTVLDGSKTPPSAICHGNIDLYVDLLQCEHPALERIANIDGSVSEQSSAYGGERRFYTDNLEPVLESIARALNVGVA